MSAGGEPGGLLDDVGCAFVSLSDDARVLAANRTLGEITGRPAESLVGQRVEALLTAGSAIFYHTHFFPLLKLHGAAREIYLSLRGRDGGDVPVLVNAARRADDAKPATALVMLPMRQRNEYEEAILRARNAAEEATRAKDRFLAVVSHELRSPLNAVLGWARLLGTGRLDAEAARRAVETIERNAQTQAKLIDDLLDLARVVSGKLRLDVAPVDLEPVVEAAIDVVRPAAEAKSIRLAAAVDARAGPVRGDADRLQQVLWNLLANAVKFTPKGGNVQVRVARVDSSVAIAVSDTGRGIASEFLPFVFEQFRQADDFSRRQGGIGLGLAITRHIVELHGGTIRVDSPGTDLGATFTVTLPVMAAYAPPAAAADDASPAGASLRGRLDGLQLLVVEDERDARELLVALLEGAGARVSATATAGAALSAARASTPDLVLSDVQLPDEEGPALLCKLREIESLRDVPAIALSARAGEAERQRALSAGFQVHIAKPVDSAQLVAAIEGLARRRDGPSD